MLIKGNMDGRTNDGRYYGNKPTTQSSQFMIDNSTSLQNDIANGNLRVLSSVIKTSPSAFDAARLLTLQQMQ